MNKLWLKSNTAEIFGSHNGYDIYVSGTQCLNCDQKTHLYRPCYFTGTITADVVILVLNKTSDEYWFLMKINTTVEGDNVGTMGGVRPGIMDYFLVKLKVASRYGSNFAVLLRLQEQF